MQEIWGGTWVRDWGWGVGRGNWEKSGRRVSKVAKYDDGMLVRSTVMGRR